ncbi:hypothetical protein BCV70DRAFT_70642 [Testicularia cyperi]|uniref:Uncharacterized protein n=1 Tax=Testicularia cyperi TaxID=1882483 RepID=A0A317XIU4_9BASI|nr:hypothetical protein BCV70DRAFT_70642 [Testicularia cyperi]
MSVRRAFEGSRGSRRNGKRRVAFAATILTSSILTTFVPVILPRGVLANTSLTPSLETAPDPWTLQQRNDIPDSPLAADKEYSTQGSLMLADALSDDNRPLSKHRRTTSNEQESLPQLQRSRQIAQQAILDRAIRPQSDEAEFYEDRMLLSEEDSYRPPVSGSSPEVLLRNPPQAAALGSASAPTVLDVAVVYDDELVGQQTGSGYVFARRTDLQSYTAGPKAALVNLFSRRDLSISHPPLIPNSSSRLLIGLILACILAVGIITFALQELYNRLRASASSQPGSPRQRRSGDGRSSRSAFLSDTAYYSLSSSVSDAGAASLEEEEESIVTPPSLSRRSSSARMSLAGSPHNENGYESDEESVRKPSPSDIHYLSLPFGFGIGYSYSNIGDGSAARARVVRMAAQRHDPSRRDLVLSGSVLGKATGALPVPSTSGGSGSDGLRSRARSIKDLCKEAISAAAAGSREIGVIAEEDGSDLPGGSASRWMPSLMTFDAPASEGGSGAATPTGAGVGTMRPPLSTSHSAIALEDLTGSASGPKARGRYFGIQPEAETSHTLVDLGNVGTTDSSHLVDPSGIMRPASTPAAPMASQVARHPQVEQLRREGRSETGKRVGKGTPTTAKLL